MELLKCQAFANVLTEEFDLAPVTVIIDGRMKRKFGRAVYATRILQLNPLLFGAQLEDTIRHEVAHFLAFDKYGETGHGATWKRCASLLGAKPKATVKTSEDAEAAQIVAATKTRVYKCILGCETKRIRKLRKGLSFICRNHGFYMYLAGEP